MPIVGLPEAHVSGGPSNAIVRNLFARCSAMCGCERYLLRFPPDQSKCSNETKRLRPVLAGATKGPSVAFGGPFVSC